MVRALPIIFLALVIPGLFFGRAVLAVFLIFSLLAFLYIDYRGKWVTGRFCLDRIKQYKWYWMILTLSLLPAIFFSYDVGESIQTLLRSLAMAVFGLYLYCWLTRFRPEGFQLFGRLLNSALLVVCCFGLYSLHEPEMLARLIGHWDETNQTPTKNPELLSKHAGYAMGILLPLIFYISLRSLGRDRVLATIAGLSVLAFCHWSMNISIVIGTVLAVSAMVLIIFVGKLKKKQSRTIALTCIAILSVAGGLQTIKTLTPPVLDSRAILGLPEPVVDYHRQHIWLYVWDMGWQKPWMGWGINALNKVPDTDIIEPVFNQPRVPGHPHNFLLEVFAETGLLPTLLLVLAFIYWLGRQMLALCQMNITLLSPVTLTTVAAILPPAFVSYSIWSPWWMLSIFMVIGIAAAMDARHRIKT